VQGADNHGAADCFRFQRNATAWAAQVVRMDEAEAAAFYQALAELGRTTQRGAKLGTGKPQ
jgi:K+/H+ antiporter YhaU regulatory subunit KhtT